MRKIIVLITSAFPYEKGEAFLEEEVKFVNCDILIILPLAGKGSPRELKTPVSYEVYSLPLHSRWAWFCSLLCQLFYGKLFQELRSLHQAGKLFPTAIMKSLSFLSHGGLYKKEAVKILSSIVKPGDSVCFYGYWFLLQAYIAVELKRYFGGTAVSRCHGGDLYEERNKLGVLPMRRYLIEQLDAIYTISEHGKKYLESRYQYLGKKITINRLGTEAGAHTAHSKRPTFSIVSCSWISEVKRVDRIISVLSRLPNKNIQWTHLGGGILENEMIKAAQRQLEGKIDWNITGVISHEEIMKQYADNDYNLFINLSSSEGIPVSIMEACSYGIPILATNVGGSSEIVDDGYNGFLVEKDFSDENVVSIIERVLQMNDNDYDCICRNSLLRWQEKFSAQNNYSKFYANLPFCFLKDEV